LGELCSFGLPLVLVRMRLKPVAQPRTRAPRRTKDLIEEALFERRRSLFSDLSVVLFDTTSLMFYGAGGESLGRHGKSKDHRPELHQVIVGIVLDDEGRPFCSETWPGYATDVKSLLPVVTRLGERFGITPDVRGRRPRHDQ
jgi:hypothetical protein